MKKIYVLVDCNNFFVSCERAFNPKIRNCPVVVLSNNDGCAVSRSNEAKDLGIKMGEPYFKWRQLAEDTGTEVFSSNFPLYGDMSQRVMDTLKEFSPFVEIYSIDEAFLDITHIDIKDYEKWALNLKERIYRCTSIPVSVGIAHTKTMCKVACEMEKRGKGVFSMIGLSEREIDDMYKQIDISEVWGIGYRYAKKLKSFGVENIYNFTKLDSNWVKKNLSVSGWRVHRELNGQAVFGVEHLRDDRKSLAYTRSFRGYVTGKEELMGYIARYLFNAFEKLRSEDMVASCITIYIRTNYHSKDKKQYLGNISISMGRYTSNSVEALKAVRVGFEKIHREGFEYRKAGVILSDLRRSSNDQYNLFESSVVNKDVLKAIDSINKKWGGKVSIATERFAKEYPHRSKVSGGFTYRWEELLTVC